MSRALVQSTLCHAAVVGENSGRLRASSGKNKMSVKMVSANGSIRGFTGLRCSNTLDMIARSSHDFHSTVAASISVSGGKARRGVIVATFERFNEKAINVFFLAPEEARRLGHNQVGTEQLLLGLIGEGTGIAAKVLKSMGINLKNARVEVEKIVGRGNEFFGAEVPFTTPAKRVLELSREESHRFGHNHIGTGHLLLGLLHDDEGVASRVLKDLGLDHGNIRTQVIRMMGESVVDVGDDV